MRDSIQLGVVVLGMTLMGGSLTSCSKLIKAKGGSSSASTSSGGTTGGTTGGSGSATPTPEPALAKSLLVGGYGAGYSYLKSAEEYDPGARTFTTVAAMSVTRVDHAAVILNDGKVLVSGGIGGTGPSTLSSAEVYDPGTRTFSATTGPMNHMRSGHTMTLLQDGQVLVTAGAFSNQVTNTAELYDSGTGSFTWVGNLSVGRKNHSATLLSDGKVLIAGGADRFDTALSSAEIYDPVAQSFSVVPNPLVNARHSLFAHLLPNGKVLLFGGRGSGGMMGTAELYDPTTEIFTATGSMTTNRDKSNGSRSMLLNNGEVFVMGGGAAERYSQLTGLFTPTSQSPAIIGVGFTIAKLPDGKILVAGGRNAGGLIRAAEVYDPDAGTFSRTTGDLNGDREGGVSP